MSSRVDPQHKLTVIVKVRFSPHDMSLLNTFATDLDVDVSTLVRDTVRRAFIDIHRRTILYYPPTRAINDKIDSMVYESGMSRQMLVSNIINYHLSIIDKAVLDEEFKKLLGIRAQNVIDGITEPEQGTIDPRT